MTVAELIVALQQLGPQAQSQRVVIRWYSRFDVAGEVSRLTQKEADDLPYGVTPDQVWELE